MRQTFYEFCMLHERTNLLKQWDESRNFPLTPDTVSYGSKKKVRWTCENGHSWQTTVHVRSEVGFIQETELFIDKRLHSDAISNVQDILKDLNDYGLISDDRYSSINGTLDTMKNNSSNLGDSLQDVSSDLSSLSGSLNNFLGTTSDVLDNLDDICDILDDYKGLGQDFTAEGKKLTELANTTLGRVNQQLTEIPALTESLNQLTSITSSSIDKGTELLDTTTKTLTASYQLLDTVNSTLRSVRSDADASTQTTLDGLLDVLDKASRSNSSNKLQNATDDIHNAIDDAKTDLEDDTNILNIDSSADLQSVTSSMNPTPSSLQFILRTQEISTDDDDDAVTSDQDAADEGVLARIVNIFKKLASAMPYLHSELTQKFELFSKASCSSPELCSSASLLRAEGSQQNAVPCLAVRPQTVQLRGYLPVIFGHIHLYVALQGLIDVGHEDPHKNGHGQHAHQHDGADDAPDPLGPSLPSVFPLMGALLCLITVVGVFFHGQRTSLSVSLFRPPTGGLRLFIRLLPAALLRKVPAAAKSTY